MKHFSAHFFLHLFNYIKVFVLHIRLLTMAFDMVLWNKLGTYLSAWSYIALVVLEYNLTGAGVTLNIFSQTLWPENEKLVVIYFWFSLNEDHCVQVISVVLKCIPIPTCHNVYRVSLDTYVVLMVWTVRD